MKKIRRFIMDIRCVAAAIALGAILTLGCSGGFMEDNENATEFKKSIFDPDDIDTINVRK